MSFQGATAKAFGGVEELIKTVTKFVRKKKMNIDNAIFQLHSQVTVTMLGLASVLVSSTTFFGDPIECFLQEEKLLSQKLLDMYCWIFGTTTAPDRYYRPGDSLPFPNNGVGIETENTDEVVRHTYYQWVCFVLFIQSMIFYLPRHLWKAWEGGKLMDLVGDYHKAIVDEEKKEKHMSLLLSYFRENMFLQDSYAYKFFLCEVLNFVNTLSQIYFMCLFLGVKFYDYGWNVLSMYQKANVTTDAMSRVFPKVGSCTFTHFGVSGSLQSFNALCILPINIINEKVYLVLWFWLITLATIGGLNVVFRAVVMSCCRARYALLAMRSKGVEKAELWNLCQMISIGDWFVIYQLSKNLEPSFYRHMIKFLIINWSCSNKCTKQDKIKDYSV